MRNFQNKTKIINASRQLRAIARLSLILWALGMVIFLAVLVAGLLKGGNARTVYLAIGGITEMALASMVSLNFYHFFTRLNNGDLFDAKTVGHLTAAGRWWLAYWVLDFSFAVIGNVCLATKMDYTFGQLFASLVVIFVAWLLREAQELQSEQSLTV